MNRLTFYFSPGRGPLTRDAISHEFHTHLVLTITPEEARRLALRMLRMSEKGDIVQIDVGGRGEWVDRHEGFGGAPVLPARLVRCEGSGQPLVADDGDKGGRVSLCGTCGDWVGAKSSSVSEPAGTLAPEHKRKLRKP